MTGLEGLAGTPQRVQSPAVHNGIGSQPLTQQPSGLSAMSGMGDLMGLGEMNGGGASNMGGLGGMGGMNDMMDGFASLDMNSSNKPPPPQQHLNGVSEKKTNEDLLGLFE